MAAFNVML